MITAPAGHRASTSIFTDAFLHLLLNCICSREELGDIGMSSEMSCICRHVPTCLCPAPRCSPGHSKPPPPPSLWRASRDTRDPGLWRGEAYPHVPPWMTADRFTHLSTRLVIPIVLTVTNFSRYSADMCSRDKNPSGNLEELSVQSALPFLRENLPGFWHLFRCYLC